MRNLKKILALVLALVMSLSLMATAGAADFSDKDQITADYTEATEVLNGLGVFQGYDNGARFEPQGEITRAEVAAIVYRIATGDTTDSQKAIYTTYNQFKDVVAGSWYEGYVTYCANAGYIKGRPGNIFDPQGKVTGYEALAMILRAVGYDKNNEFSGTEWRLHTASIAKKLNITKNIANTVQLSQPATREVVAELLFQSILCKTVTYNAATLDYTADAKTLAEQTLKMEKIEGVVVANEIANLNGTKALDAGRTELADGRTLNVTSTLDNIGEASRYYAIKNPQNVYVPVVDKMYPVDDCKTVENEYKGTSVSDLAKKLSVKTDANTKYFTDYDVKNGDTTSDWRIRYIIDVTELATKTGYAGYDKTELNGKYKIVNQNDGAGEVLLVSSVANYASRYPNMDPNHYVYENIINIGKKISAKDQELIRYIFDNADKYTQASVAGNFSLGEVYAGTQSNDDLSDRMSHKQFTETYYIDPTATSFSKVGNGEYLKLTDVDNDGIVDYALKRTYTLTEVVQVRNDNKDVYYENMSGAQKVTYNDGYTPAEGGKVLLNKIEGNWYGEAVEPTLATIKTVNVNTEKVTAVDGTEYEESAITNDTDMDDRILDMDEKVEYNLYLDKGGYIRAYELAQGSQYGLLTEMYPGTGYNVALVTNTNWTVELMTGADKYPVEYKVLNSYVDRQENPFIDSARLNPFRVMVNGVLGNTGWDYLQQAIAHLDRGARTDFMVSSNNGRDDYDGEEFKYNKDAADKGQSWTNVARYVKGEDGVSLYTAAQYATRNGQKLYYTWHDDNKNQIVDANEVANYNYTATTAGNLRKGAKVTAEEWATFATAYNKANGTTLNTVAEGYLEPVYAVDYIKLATSAIAAKAKHYDIAATNNNFENPATYGTQYGLNNNGYIDTLSTTEFYLISQNGSIRYFKGYENMPAIAAKYIRAAYAVAENTVFDNNQNDYWVGRVVVIELNDGYSYEDIALLTPYSKTTVGTLSNSAERQSAAGTHTFKGMSTKTTSVTDITVDDTVWGSGWNINLYGLNGVTVNDNGTVNATHATPIDKNFNDNHIFAGRITREVTVGSNGYYDIVINGQHRALTNASRFYGVGRYSIADANKGTDFVRILGTDAGRYILDKEIQDNDRVIYVTDAAGNIAYVIDVDYHIATSAGNGTWVNNSDLITLWRTIDAEQSAAPTTLGLGSLTIKGQPVTLTHTGYAKGTGEVTLTNTQASSAAMNWTYTLTGDTTGTATVTVNEVGGGSITGTSTAVINGDKTWIVTVTSGDGKTVVVYNVTIKVENKNNKADLTSLSIKGVPVNLARATAGTPTGTTTVTTPYAVNSATSRLAIPAANNNSTALKIAATYSTGATVTATVDGTSVSTVATDKTALTAGDHTIVVTVTSEDNSVAKEYTIYVTAYDYTASINFVGVANGDGDFAKVGTTVANAAVLSTTATPVKVDDTKAYDFVVIPNDTYYISSDATACSVTYTLSNGTTGNAEFVSGNTWRIPASLLAPNTAITVTVTEKAMTKVTLVKASGVVGNASIGPVVQGGNNVKRIGNDYYVIPNTDVNVYVPSNVAMSINNQVYNNGYQGNNSDWVYRVTIGKDATTINVG